MGEELFTLLFVLFIILASVLDAVGRSRKKKRRMEELEREDSSGEGKLEPARRREPAETMVPEDLWAILTGQEPPSQTRGEAPSPEEPPREPHGAVAVPDHRMSSRGRAESAESGDQTTADEVPTRRGERWMEGTRGRGASESWGAAAASIEAQEEAVYGSLDEPWGELDDIAAGEIAVDGAAEPQVTAAPSAYRLRSAAVRRPRSAYTRLLESGSREDLRKAIVLREVLDRPVGFRDRVGPEGNW